jgi:hypothetical protein
VHRPHLHWISTSKCASIIKQRAVETKIVAVELADDATPLALTTPATQPADIIKQ